VCRLRGMSRKPSSQQPSTRCMKNGSWCMLGSHRPSRQKYQQGTARHMCHSRKTGWWYSCMRYSGRLCPQYTCHNWSRTARKRWTRLRICREGCSRRCRCQGCKRVATTSKWCTPVVMVPCTWRTTRHTECRCRRLSWTHQSM
jgi:hypothetical protein